MARTVSLREFIFALNASTSIPLSPVAGNPYRNSSVAEATINKGWPFSVVVDSATFNELMYRLTSVIKEIEQNGVLDYSLLVNYSPGSIVKSNNVIYQCLVANGPKIGAGTKDPANGANPTYWVDYLDVGGTATTTTVDSAGFTRNLSTNIGTVQDALDEIDALAISSSTYVGSLILMATSAVPENYLECNGAAVSRTTYSELFNAIGTTYGAGNGSTTFNVPDTRGQFIRGWDHGRGIDIDRTLGSFQNGEIQEHSHWDKFAFGDGGVQIGGPVGATETAYAKAFYPVTADLRKGPFGGGDYSNGLKTEVTGGTETRPRNIAFMYCIRYTATIRR